MTELDSLDRETLGELLPLLRRAVGLDPTALVRLRGTGSAVFAFLTVFDVLVARGVQSPAEPFDLTYYAAEAIAFAESSSVGSAATVPQRKDADWRGGLPSSTGWRRIETIGDDTIRPLVRSGALALKEAAARGPGLSARNDVAEALLDSVVLTVSDPDEPQAAQLSLRMLSALTRMGFLPRGGSVGVDVNRSWTRLAAEYGSVYAPPSGLRLG